MKSTDYRIFVSQLALLAILVISLSSILCAGFSPECKATRPTTSTGLPSLAPGSTSTSTSVSASPIEKNHSIGKFSPDDEITKTKISYRSAKPMDIPAIARLLNSVFDDNENEDEQGMGIHLNDDGDDHTTRNNIENENDKTTDNNKPFIWDSLETESSEEELSTEKHIEFIERQLAKRMADAKKEDSLPHSFLVATRPYSNVGECTNGQQEDLLVGFLEIGTLPSPFGGSVELPYIGNVAVANEVRRRKVGSTLVRLATKIAAKWCTPSSKTSSFPPFLFLSVERDNCDALLFYERLGFEELSVGKKAKLETSAKVYLATEIE